MTEPKNMTQEEMAGAVGLPFVQGVTDMQLDLDKDQKLRAAALMMAIKYHLDTICRDPMMYQQMKMDGRVFQPTMAKNVVAEALLFETYLRGDYAQIVQIGLDEMAEAFGEQVGGPEESTAPDGA